MVGQYLFLYSLSGPDDLSNLVDSAYRRGAILAYSKSDETAFAERLFRKTREFADQRFRGLPVHVGIAGGSLGAQAAVNAVVVREKVRNIAQVGAIIFLLSALALRSIVGGLFVVVPLAVALGMTVGVMGWTGVWLSMSTSAVMAMGVSIGADFAIYLIFRLREELARASLADGVRRALVTSGTAIFFVSSAVALGYLVLVFSGFKVVGASGGADGADHGARLHGRGDGAAGPGDAPAPALRAPGGGRAGAGSEGAAGELTTIPGARVLGLHGLGVHLGGSTDLMMALTSTAAMTVLQRW